MGIKMWISVTGNSEILTKSSGYIQILRVCLCVIGNSEKSSIFNFHRPSISIIKLLVKSLFFKNELSDFDYNGFVWKIILILWNGIWLKRYQHIIFLNDAIW